MAILLSLGTNQGNRQENLHAALEGLRALPGVSLTQCSPTYETEPVGLTDQPMFLNLAAEIETALAPLELLNAVKQLEGRLGRTPGLRWGPRTIDIDLILWNDLVLDSGTLTLPHREFRNRAFVLQPMMDIAPNAVDPLTGRTVAELAAAPGVLGAVRRLEHRTP